MRARANAHVVNVWSLSLLFILRKLNYCWNVKWTIKLSLHHWGRIIKFIILATICSMHTFLVKDGDTTPNINTHKCLHQWSRCAVITSLNLLFWSPGMSNPGVLNFFKNVAQLQSKNWVHSPSTTQLLHWNNFCTCTEQKWEQPWLTNQKFFVTLTRQNFSVVHRLRIAGVNDQSQVVRLTEAKSQQGKKFDEIWRVHILHTYVKKKTT